MEKASVRKHTCREREGVSFHHPVSGMCEKGVDGDGNYPLHSRRGMHCPVLAEDLGGGKLFKKKKKTHNARLSFPFLEKKSMCLTWGVKINKVFALA